MKTFALFQREMQAYFYSPMAWMVMAAYLFFCGYSAAYVIDIYNANRLDISMRDIFYNMEFLALLVAPMISMRLVAEERKSGTLEMLVTAPVSDVEIVLAKFAGALVFYITLMVPTLLYLYILSQHATLEYGSVLTGYLGQVLIGALFLSLGLLVSTVCKDQIVAALVSLVSLFIFYSLSGYAESVDTKFLGINWREVVVYVGFMSHYESFRKGVLDSRDLLYYLSVTGVFLFLSVRSLESRRWV